MKKKASCRPGAFVLALLLAAACSPKPPGAGPNSLSTAEMKQGWALLFNGRSLKGWHGSGFKNVPAGRWAVEDGTIVTLPAAGEQGRKTAGFDLVSDETFADFELSFEWKVGPGGNSGLKYNVSDEITRRFGPGLSGRGGAVGFEYQLLDDALNPDARVGPHRKAGSLYDIVPVAAGSARPAGAFNASRIVFCGERGEHWLNGVKVLEYGLGSPELRARLAASKFRDIPGFAQKRKGPIVLQYHGDRVVFRAIKVRRLEPAFPPAA